METKIETPIARPSLLLLNDDCLLIICKLLNIDDCINVAKTCLRLRFVAEHLFKKYKTFEVNSQVLDKGEEYVDDLFQHIGLHVTSLVFSCMDNAPRNLSQILSNVSNKCKNLKNLKIYNFVPFCAGDQPVYCFDNVEHLTLQYCHFHTAGNDLTNFFDSFHRLNSLIENGSLCWEDHKTIFQNNRSIEGFVSLWNDFDGRLLELIPNVKRLRLSDGVWQLDSLLKLNRLNKLQLSCNYKNIKKFLKEFPTKELVEEMHLEGVVIDDLSGDLFDNLTSFSKLQLLVLERDYVSEKLKPSITWPTQLKKLRLSDFECSQNVLIAIIEQIKSIESIDIGKCWLAENDITSFNDVTKLCQDIRHIIEHSNRKLRLEVVLPRQVKPADPSKKYFYASERLRVHRGDTEYNPLGIEIHFEL